MLYIIQTGAISLQLNSMLMAAIDGVNHVIIHDVKEMPDLRGKKVLWVVQLDFMGISLPTLEVLSKLSSLGRNPLAGTTGGILIHSPTDFFTKSAAAHIIFVANSLGCNFIGHSIVEIIEDYKNLKTWQKSLPLTLEEISFYLSKQLVNRLMNENIAITTTPKLVAIHSSSRKTSNTLYLWGLTKKHLASFQIEELHVENASVFDCYGCSYKACLDYSLKNSCYYKGVMTQKILPTIEEADGVIWICPNYNDSVSSNLMAVINRLTTLYRRIKLYDKLMFSIIVSGNSGSDSVARQLIDALNINKGFYLPGNFSLMEIANDPGTIEKLPDIEERAKGFADIIIKNYRSSQD